MSLKDIQLEVIEKTDYLGLEAQWFASNLEAPADSILVRMRPLVFQSYMDFAEYINESQEIRRIGLPPLGYRDHWVRGNTQEKLEGDKLDRFIDRLSRKQIKTICAELYIRVPGRGKILSRERPDDVIYFTKFGRGVASFKMGFAKDAQNLFSWMNPPRTDYFRARCFADQSEIRDLMGSENMYI